MGGEKRAATRTRAHTCTHTHTCTPSPFQASSARTQGRLERKGRPVSMGVKPRTEPCRSRGAGGRGVGKRAKIRCRRSAVWFPGLEAPHRGKETGDAHILPRRGRKRGRKKSTRKSRAEVGQRERRSRRQAREEAGRGWTSWGSQDTKDVDPPGRAVLLLVSTHEAWRESEQGLGYPSRKVMGLLPGHMMPVRIFFFLKRALPQGTPIGKLSHSFCQKTFLLPFLG